MNVELKLLMHIFFHNHFVRFHVQPFSCPPQVTHFGCKSFALLFDDIDHNMCPADKEVFSSFAHAQVSITNEIYQYLGEPETFLFCPTGTSVLCLNPFAHFTHLLYLFVYSLFVFLPWNTEYCGTFCYPNVSQSPYLHTVGEKLLPDIDVLWTGEPNTGQLANIIATLKQIVIYVRVVDKMIIEISYRIYIYFL